jgi:hypothetical protein
MAGSFKASREPRLKIRFRHSDKARLVLPAKTLRVRSCLSEIIGLGSWSRERGLPNEAMPPYRNLTMQCQLVKEVALGTDDTGSGSTRAELKDMGMFAKQPHVECLPRSLPAHDKLVRY